MPLLAGLAALLLAVRLGVRVTSLLKQHADARGGELLQQQHHPLADGRPGAVFTKAQLAKFDGSPRGAPAYLAVLGEVFDVSGKPEFYSKGSGYHHFVATDGTRAFVTGGCGPLPAAGTLLLASWRVGDAASPDARSQAADGSGGFSPLFEC
jgi:predicted heme/steroid binding protein